MIYTVNTVNTVNTTWVIETLNRKTKNKINLDNEISLVDKLTRIISVYVKMLLIFALNINVKFYCSSV